MLAIGLEIAVVGLSQLHRGDFIGVMPCALASNEFPPHTHIFHGLDPRCILDLAGLVQVENQARGQDIARVIDKHDGAPRGLAWGLHVAFIALGIGREP